MNHLSKGLCIAFLVMCIFTFDPVEADSIEPAKTSEPLENLSEEPYADCEEEIEQYEYAGIVWRTLIEHGYSEYCAAGIIGNMMVECGGNTLDIDPYAYNKHKSHYGVCQWSRKYFPYAEGTCLDEQIEILLSTIEYEINTFGNLYKRSFGYIDFTLLANEKDAALAFAKCYERCGSGSYGMRKKCATIAINYFSGGANQ